MSPEIRQTVGATLLLATSFLSSSCSREERVVDSKPGVTVMHYDHPTQPSAETSRFFDQTGIAYMPFPKGTTSGHVKNAREIEPGHWEVFGVAWSPSDKTLHEVVWFVKDGKVASTAVFVETEEVKN